MEGTDGEAGRETISITFYDLVSDIMWHCFCLSPFVEAVIRFNPGLKKGK